MNTFVASLLISVLVVCAYANSSCIHENFTQFGCNQVIPQGASIFGGKATITKLTGNAGLGTYNTQTEDCEFSFGACSTLSFDTPLPVLIGADFQYSLSIKFAQKFRSFGAGKVYGSGVITFQFRKGGSVVLSDSIDRNGLDCSTGSADSWSVAGGFDEVIISGSIFAVTDLSACFNGAVLFTGGAGGETLVFEDTCIHCVDALRINYWKKFTCNDNGSCQTRTYLGSNCTSINFAINSISVSTTLLELIFPIPHTVCIVTTSVPPTLAARGLPDALPLSHVEL